MTNFASRVFCCTLVAMLAFGNDASAQDGGKFKPWQLTYKAQDLDVLVVSYKDGSAKTNYYVTFTLTNNSKNPAPLGLHIVATVGRGKRTQKHIAFGHPDAEAFYKRMSRASDIKNVQEINAMKTLAPGKSVKGIAVFGAFDRRWNDVTVSVTGLRPRAIHTRVRKFGNAGFTLAHPAYNAHNAAVMKKAGKDADYTEPFVVLQQTIVHSAMFTRRGDEFAPQLDPITRTNVDWTVRNPKIVIEKKKLYSE